MILYFKPKRGDEIKATQFYNLVTSQLGLDVVFLDERHLNSTVENLLSGEVDLKESSMSYQSSESFVLLDIEEDDLNDLLQLLRENQISLPLKAKTTSSNVKWTLIELIAHVSEEAQVMKALHKLYQLFTASQSFIELENYDKALWENFVLKQNEVKAYLDRVGKEEIELDETLALIESFNESVLKLMAKEQNNG